MTTAYSFCEHCSSKLLKKISCENQECQILLCISQYNMSLVWRTIFLAPFNFMEKNLDITKLVSGNIHFTIPLALRFIQVPLSLKGSKPHVLYFDCAFNSTLIHPGLHAITNFTNLAVFRFRHKVNKKKIAMFRLRVFLTWQCFVTVFNPRNS